MGPTIHTHYDNLKVARNAPDFVIRAAYKALSQQYHPDKHGGSAAAANAMRLINEAYAELSDPVRRASHDAWIAQQEIKARVDNQADARRQGAAPRDSAPRPDPPSKAPSPQPPPQATTRSARSSGWSWGGVLLILVVVLALMNTQGSKTKTAHKSAGPTDSSIPSPSASRYGSTASAANPPFVNRTPAPVALQPATFPSTPASVPMTSQLPRGRVNAVELNVRAGPGVNHDVLARLRFLDTVSFEGPASNGWIPVSHRAGFGYVNATYILAGSDADTLRQLCQEEGTPLSTGTVLMHPSAHGDHELRIVANHNRDALVKLKDAQGHTAFSGFVRRGQAHTFQGIPSGVYTAWFATGTGFSSKCGRFLVDMHVSYDPTPRHFRNTQAGNLEYSTVMEYSLQLQRNGNFSPSTADPVAFLAD
ncbi:MULTISPECIES: J domain-containing protein [unclassified Achromobacter]|uniref:J domain-containing protein n=1 Tax=unclassified Achromobacter TaxID=2626865 RepID=UPI001C457447|nr:MULTISPECIES: J domain-containing protein [unclassified Achromobacter]MBV7500407.1 DnaJ domain-containing protein [Achromobacter sp. ACM05]